MHFIMQSFELCICSVGLSEFLFLREIKQEERVNLACKVIQHFFGYCFKYIS